MEDTFFNQLKCDRCGSALVGRIMSWFTKETEIKRQLRAKGFDNALEGCGYVPDPSKM